MLFWVRPGSADPSKGMRRRAGSTECIKSKRAALGILGASTRSETGNCPSAPNRSFVKREERFACSRVARLAPTTIPHFVEPGSARTRRWLPLLDRISQPYRQCTCAPPHASLNAAARMDMYTLSGRPRVFAIATRITASLGLSSASMRVDDELNVRYECGDSRETPLKSRERQGDSGDSAGSNMTMLRYLDCDGLQRIETFDSRHCHTSGCEGSRRSNRSSGTLSWSRASNDACRRSGLGFEPSC